MTELTLAHDLAFEDLYRPDGLARIDGLFLDALGESDADLKARLLAARDRPEDLEAKAASELLIAVAPHLEDFVGGLFGIRRELRALAGRHQDRKSTRLNSSH